VLCRRSGPQLCAGCRATLPGLTPPLCALCGAPTAWSVTRCRECSRRALAFACARAAAPYDERVRRLVHAWKERGLRFLDAELASLVVARVPRPACEVVTFVPGDPWRTRMRGHAPAERLARAVAERWSLPCERLLRRPAARRQRGLSRAERARGVGFEALERADAIVVDDVYTTGATAHAAARALGGRVEVVTFARATLR
jgi:predicted amidophosphoribosyltransferase